MVDMQRFWILLIVVFSVSLLYLLQPILMPFLVGALLAYLGDPIADRLESLGLGRTLSVCIVFCGLTMLLILSLLLTVPLIGKQIDLLAIKIPQWLNIIQEQLIPWLQQTFNLPANSFQLVDVKKILADNWMTAGDLLAVVWKQLAGSSFALVAALANVLLIPVVTFYLLRDWDILMAHFQDMLPRSSERTVVMLASQCDEILGAFIRGQLLVMLALSIIYSVGLSLIGLELALILGLLAGLASIVPYMGVIVGIFASGLAAYFQFYALAPLIGVAVVFGIGQLLEGMVLTPLLVGDRIGLHPVAVIFAIMAGGQLVGFTGILLALPVAAVVMVLLRHAHKSYKGSRLYTADGEQEH